MCYFLKKFFENSPASGGLRPRTPSEVEPLKCSRPEPKSWLRRWLVILEKLLLYRLYIGGGE